MDDLDEDVSSTGFESLFIREEERTEGTTVEPKSRKKLPGSTETQLGQSALMKPYLQEMDELLKSCEELTGISFGSQYAAICSDATPRGWSHSQGKAEGSETRAAPYDYLPTSYMDTHVDGAEAEDKKILDDVINTFGVPRQTEMPLTSAGSKLSETMMEYEGQLLGMLAMLDKRMEEAGTDSKVANSGQEYINIRKNSRELEIPSMHDKSFKTSEDAIRMAQDLAANGSQGWDQLVQEERPEMQDQEVHDKQMSFPWQRISTDDAKQDQIYCGGTNVRHLFNEERNELKMDAKERGSGINDELKALGSQMEECLVGVQQLEKKRKELLVEVLLLRGNKDGEGEEEETEEWIDNKVVELIEAVKKEEEGRTEEKKRRLHSLKEERAEEERKMWTVKLERQGLQEELRKQKRRLFAAARDCASSQAVLNNQRREVELLKREKEQLNSFLHQLREESDELRSTQQQRLHELRAKLHAQSSGQPSTAQEELSECRRSSCGDVQQYLQGGLKALEDRYEPILLALLKRRGATAGALVKAKEQAEALRAQLKPLREEMQQLRLQKACLEEKLKLIDTERCEDVGRYKEAVFCLEERARVMKTELEIQKRKSKEMEVLRDSVAKQLLLHRAAIKDQTEHNHEDKTNIFPSFSD